MGARENLDDRSRSFADSLIAQHGRRGLSDKQWYWVDQLRERAVSPQPAPAPVNVGSVKGVIDLLETARKHLKHPAVLVMADAGQGRHRTLRLSIAGERAKVPGSVNVCSAGGYGDRDWFGRVTRVGEFEPCRRYDSGTQTAITAALRALANDPAKAAADYGKLTGSCCFCGLTLTDERSTAAGFGPVCAKHFGLAWGSKVAAEPVVDVEDVEPDAEQEALKLVLSYGSTEIHRTAA